VPSERCSIEEQSIEYCGWLVIGVPQLCLQLSLVTLCAVRTTSLVIPRPSTIFYRLLNERLSEDTQETLGNVMPKHVGATIYN
jgi:hypothetical protein